MTYPSFMAADRIDADLAYRSAAVADELAIAKLLGWTSLPAHGDMMRSNHNTASLYGEKGHAARLGSQFLPRWRRDWAGAGELIGRCGLRISPNGTGVVVSTESGRICGAIYVDHPDKDSAIRFAMCQVAIQFLTAERERKS